MEHRKIRVFVASPDDVQIERSLLHGIIERLNREVSDVLGVSVHLQDWRNDTIPGMGRAQARVNPLIERSDIFIGILWQRFGTPSGKTADGREFASGTEEEFYLALELWKRDGAPRIMLYFSDLAARPSEIDVEQAARVKEFRNMFSPVGPHPGLFVEYQTREEFRDLVHQHLIRQIFELADGPTQGTVVPDFVRISPNYWNSLFDSSSFGNFLFMYSTTWRNTYLQGLRGILQRGGEVRVLLPLPDTEGLSFRLMASRLSIEPIALKKRIEEASSELRCLGECGEPTIRYTAHYITHALYLFERGGVAGLYSYSSGRSPSGAILFSQGELHRQLLQEFSALYETSQESL
jgi:hypothetical protein